MGNKTKASILTMITSVVNSALLMVFNLIYNNLLISSYGSSLNGLISTLTQFVSLFTIIEGGFTTAAIVATYEPIVNGDYDHLNSILYTTKRVYLRIGAIITIAVLIFGSIYINFIDSPLSYSQTFTLLIISVITTASSLCFLSKYSVLLQGTNREFIQIFLNAIAKTVTWIISVILIMKGVNLIIVYSINILNVGLNIFLSKAYEKTAFPYVNYRGIYDKKLISGTGDVLFQKIAGTIFTSTDLVLISVFINLASASVYNLYYHVFHAVLSLLLSISQAPFNSFGQLIKSDNDKLKVKYYFNIYQHFVLIVASILLTCVGAVIIPFVKVYTANFNDFNYIYPSLSVLFFLQIFAQVINRPYGTILNASGNFRRQNIQCGLAAIVNIIVSLAFIKVWGLSSIILGSFIGTLIILFMNIYHAYKNVLSVSAKRTCINIFFNYIFSIGLIVLSLKVNYSPSSCFTLLVFSLLCGLISMILIMLFNLLIDYRSTRDVIEFGLDQIKIRKR